MKFDIKAISGILTMVIGIVTASFIIEDRYANADVFKKYKTEQAQVVQQTYENIERRRLEDAIFKNELKAPLKRTTSDEALLNRYKKQLIEISQ